MGIVVRDTARLGVTRCVAMNGGVCVVKLDSSNDLSYTGIFQHFQTLFCITSYMMSGSIKMTSILPIVLKKNTQNISKTGYTMAGTVFINTHGIACGWIPW